MQSSVKIKFLVVMGAVFCIVAVGFIAHSLTTNRMGGNGECNDNYSGACVPNVKNDIDCSAVGHSVIVARKDVYHFDADHDGVGCETYGS